MELYQLRYFLAAAETGSFTKAAERVHVSQPTLSAGIKKLEHDLGVELFERRSRRTFLSAAGAKFLDHARIVVAECNRARYELGAEAQIETLRLGTLATVPAPRLAALLADFAKSRGGISVALVEDTAPRLTERMDQGRIDAAITFLDENEVIDQKALPLYRERMVLAMAPNHPLARRQSLTMKDLDGIDYIYRSHCPHVRAMTRTFNSRGIRPRVACRTDQDERALALVAAGLGVSVVPDGYARPGLFLEPLGDLNVQSTVALVWPSGQDSEALAGFRDFAASHSWRPRAGDNQVEDRLAWVR